MLIALLALTLLGGCGFLGIKYVEYKAKWQHGLLWGTHYQSQTHHGEEHGVITSYSIHYTKLYDNGIRNMSSYGAQIPVEDRWAIVAYVRALQRSRLAYLDDVPAEARQKLTNPLPPGAVPQN